MALCWSFAVDWARYEANSNRLMKATQFKVSLVITLMALGVMSPLQAARRTTTSNPPPTSGTIDQPVISAL